MKLFLFLGCLITSILGAICEEYVSDQCYGTNQNRHCDCKDGWGGDGCCDEQKTDPVGIVVGCLILILILIAWYFRKEIKKFLQITDIELPEQRQRRQNNRNQQRIYPEQQSPIDEPDTSMIIEKKRKQVPLQLKTYSKQEKQQINSQDCSICLQKLTKDVCVTPCLHIFHMKCIEQVLLHQKLCPLDRLDLNLEQLILIL